MAYGWNLIGGYTGYVSFGNVRSSASGRTPRRLVGHGIDNLAAGVAVGAIASAAFAGRDRHPGAPAQGHYFGSRRSARFGG